MAEASTGGETTYVTLRFDRALTESEIEQLRTKTDAIEALFGGGHHHDHDVVEE
jgi:hypothetical protein